MAPYCYYQPVRGENLPDPEANKQVQEVANAKREIRGAAYSHFDVNPEEAVGKYNCENGMVVARWCI